MPDPKFDINAICKFANERAAKISVLEGLQAPSFTCSIATSKQVAERMREGRAEFDATFPGFNRLFDRLYHALGLMPESATLSDIERKLASSQMPAFFDPKKNEMVIVEDIMRKASDFTFNETISHEAVHAVQMKNLNGFARTLRPALDSLGHLSAALAFYEGDASYTAMKFRAGGNSKVPREQVSNAANSFEQGVEKLEVQGVPKFFVRDEGLKYAFALRYAYENRERLNQLRERPPKTTAELLHPSKNVRVESPVFADNQTPALSSTLGEDSIRYFLANWIDLGRASQAASGWSGDEIRVYDQLGRNIRWGIRFESEKHKTVFVEALLDSWNKRFGSPATVRPDGSFQWANPSYRATVTQQARQVTIDMVRLIPEPRMATELPGE